MEPPKIIKTKKLPVQLSLVDDMMFYDMQERIDSDAFCRFVSPTDVSGLFIAIRSIHRQIAVDPGEFNK